jgi:DNA-binding transcriptional MerR regulator
VYKIGELSKNCKISVKTLRYYNSEGLLVPDKIDKFTGYRYYSASKLGDCNKILALKELGFTLDEIKKQMNAKASTEVLALIVAKESELSFLKTQTESQLRRLSDIKDIITRENEKMFNIVIRSADTLRIAYVRNIYANKSEAYTRLEEIRKQLPTGIIGKRNVIINYETEYTERDFDLSVGVEITGKLTKDSGFEDKIISFPSDVASLVCNKNDIDNAYSSLLKNLEENNCQIIGAFYEIYHDDGTVELKVPVYRLKQRSKTTRKDDINLPFEDDPEVIGYWQVIDYLPTKEHFNINKIKYTGEKLFKEFYFLPNGQRYWCFGWTKGYMLCSSGDGDTCDKYETFSLDGENYMYLEFKTGDYIFRNGLPEYMILKQIDNMKHTLSNISKKDVIDYQFVNDELVLGKWTSVDFVEKPEFFKANATSFDNELWCAYIIFEDDGVIEAKYGECVIRYPERFLWTKGYRVDIKESTAEKYELMRIDNVDYLFLELKSGDYIYGNREPWYYVFVRE